MKKLLTHVITGIMGLSNVRSSYLGLLVIAGFCNVAYASESYKDEYIYRLTQPQALSCLSHAIFEEANTESSLGQRLVAVTILNRAVENNMSICNVIKQKHQYSFYKAGFKFNRMTESFTERVSMDILSLALSRKLSNYNNITLYHTKSVNPDWNRSEIQRVYTVGEHVFYKIKEK